MEPSAAPVLETQAVPPFRIATFWRRVGALVVDGMVLGAIGFPLGLLLGERFAPVGTPARLLGLLIVIPYFGVLGSQAGKGQTLGKRLLGLRVVDANGQPLASGRSFARAALLSLPWIFNGIRFGSLSAIVLATLWIAGILIFGVGGAIIGTYVLNRRTRQALHDLLVGSYVIQADGIGLHAPAVASRKPMVASMVWIGLVIAGTTAMVAVGPDLMASRLPPALMESVSAIPGASSLEVKNITTWSPGRSSKVLVAVLWYRGPREDMKKAAQEVAAAMLKHHPEGTSVPTLAVTIIRGWDIGIASTTSAQNFAQTPAQWQAELGP